MDSEKTPPHQSSAPSLHPLQEIIEEDLLSLHLHLLQEIIEEEILSRLPVKSLLRFRCVSKPWRSLIDSKRFIKAHLHNYTNKTTDHDHWKTILHCRKHGLRQHGSKESSYNSYWDEPSLEPTRIVDPKNDHLMAGMVVDRCNGLLCIYEKQGCFFFWNPATKISVKLPKIDLQRQLNLKKWGFGCDEGSGAYKVFVALSDRKQNQTKGQLYSSKTNSWKTVDEVGSLSLCTAFACLISGRFHWLTESFCIESFDLKSEVFGRIELPFKPEAGDRPWLKEIEGCLAVDCHNDNDKTRRRIWLLEDYGMKEKESWVEVIFGCLDNRTTGCCYPVFYPESLVSPVLEKD